MGFGRKLKSAAGARSTDLSRRRAPRRIGGRVSHRWGRGRRSHVTTRTRNRIMARDRGLCQIQSPQCTEVATVVDHIHPLSEGGTDEDENLQAACDACHDPKSLAEAQRGNRRRRAWGYYPAEPHPGLVE